MCCVGNAGTVGLEMTAAALLAAATGLEARGTLGTVCGAKTVDLGSFGIIPTLHVYKVC